MLRPPLVSGEICQIEIRAVDLPRSADFDANLFRLADQATPGTGAPRSIRTRKGKGR
jgi:hypothetical protein